MEEHTDTQRTRRSPGILGAANVVVSGVLGIAVLWLPLTLLFIGIGGLPALGAGLFCLAAWYGVQLLLNRLERIRAEAVYADGIPVPQRRRSMRTGFLGFLHDQWLILSSSAFWRSTAHTYIAYLYGLIVCGLVAAAGGFGANVLVAAINPEGASLALGASGLGRAAMGVGGVLLMACAAAVLWFSAYLDRALYRGLLPPTRAAALEAEVTTLETARVGAVDAATAERLRIERDLHDGIQPNLVALSMKIGMAKAKLPDDPAGARALLDEAHAESKAAVTELRQLARGIHPAVLTDRGLDPAISALAARSVVPVRVDVDVPGRVDREAESVAYFIVAEALTNIGKHAEAGSASVSVRLLGGAREGGAGDGGPERLQIVVVDDGRGGAAVSRGGSSTGLAGLADRVAAARGTWSITSPVGGPTTIVAEVPCAS